MRLLLAATDRTAGLRLLADTGLLEHAAPELAAQRGVPQNKVPGEDLWDHSVRSVGGAVADPPYLRLAALLHDLGKPSTMADGRFVGHESVGADMARALLDRWHWPTAERDLVVHLIRQHMFGYVPRWSDAAVRRFIVKVDSGAALDLRSLAVDGSDLMTEFGWQPGPIVGTTLQRLLDRVIGDPTLNTRDRLLSVARSIVAADGRS
jgi:putative nucleotidyltransferase with HDIG domain